MSEVTRGEILDIVGRLAASDQKYRKALLANPKAVLSKQMNQELPANLKVKVVEESADTIYLIAPYAPPAEGDELSDDDLERVAGGKSKGDRSEQSNTYTCNDATGIGTRVEVDVSA